MDIPATPSASILRIPGACAIAADDWQVMFGALVETLVEVAEQWQRAAAEGDASVSVGAWVRLVDCIACLQGLGRARISATDSASPLVGEVVEISAALSQTLAEGVRARHRAASCNPASGTTSLPE